jgi:hypothetical protein
MRDGAARGVEHEFVTGKAIQDLNSRFADSEAVCERPSE